MCRRFCANAIRACLVLLLLIAGCSTEIIHDLSEGEANEIMAVLHQQGITGEKVRTLQGKQSFYAVSVGRGDAIRAWSVLREENLPRPKRKGLGEIFGNTSLVPTATQERALMHHALAEEISRTLQSVEGVLEARVHVVLPARDPLAPVDSSSPAPRASVLLRTTTPAPLSKQEVQQLVAGSMDAMKPESVAVLILPAHSPSKTAAPEVPPLTQVGPFLVADASKTLLRITLGAGLGLVLVLGAGLGLLARRYRSLLVESRKAKASLPPIFSKNLESSLGLLSRSLAHPGRSTEAGRDSSGS